MRPSPNLTRHAALLALGAWLATAPAGRAASVIVRQPPSGQAGAFAVDDPYERINRRVYAFNQVIYRRALRPAAVFYAHAVPSFVRARLRSAFSNLGEPVVAINDALQGRAATAGATFTRLAVNTTFGLAGLFDVAGRGGRIPHHDNGFGVTLGRWGVRTGPYLYLPVLGPSTVRDLVGSGVDAGLDPLRYTRYPYDYAVGGSSTVLGGLDTFAEHDGDLKALAAQSTDAYATLRSAYLQNKAAQVTGGQVDVNALPSFDDPGAGPATTPAAAGSTAPTPGALAHPAPALPGAPAGDAGALPVPGSPPPGPQARLSRREDDAPIATMALRAERAPRPLLLASR